MKLSELIQISQEILNLDKLQSIQYESFGDGEFYMVIFQTNDMKNYSVLFKGNFDTIQTAYRYYEFLKANDLTELLI